MPSQIPFIWQVYTENIDPLLKILHVPTMNSLIRKLRTNMDILTPGLEALMFSIYFSAITSMEEDEVGLLFEICANDWQTDEKLCRSRGTSTPTNGICMTSTDSPLNRPLLKLDF